MYKKLLNLFWSKSGKQSFGSYNIVKPNKVISSERKIPGNIALPHYITSTLIGPKSIELITNVGDVENLKKSCSLAANILQDVSQIIKPGITTQDIDDLVFNKCVSSGAYPSTLNYKGFPKSVCTSVNNVIAHGIPDMRKLEDGDIINVDVTVFLNDFHGDTSKTFLVGDVDVIGRHLVETTEETVYEAIKICKPGVCFNVIGSTIERIANENSLSVISRFCGHGIGRYFHGPPDIYHFDNYYNGIMVPGMAFTIEPILTQGADDMKILDDNWTAVTVDNARTAQFEHTILITDYGNEILTK